MAETAGRFRDLLLAGRSAEVERELRPGVDFALRVKALARVGTAEAGRVLERQLGRRLSRDPVEQTWYWADVASGLRELQYVPALPALLRCADAAAELSAGTVLAAEVVAFPTFATTLCDLTAPLARPALGAITRVARGCRSGVIEPAAVLAMGLGNHLALVSEKAQLTADPWLSAAQLEAERFFRRLLAWERLLPADVRPLVKRQRLILAETAGPRQQWLKGAPARLIERFPAADSAEKTAILRCLFEFRANLLAIFSHLPDRSSAWWEQAVRCLTWSASSVSGMVIARHATELLGARRNRGRAAVVLSTLRGHPCIESERVVLRAAGSAEPELRRAAAASLGWWPPFNSRVVLPTLQTLRTDPQHLETRQAATAALARLGSRSALEEIRRELTSEEPGVRTDAALRIAEEELSWLWPELQDAAETADTPTALAAAEAAERLREYTQGLVG